MLKMRDVYVAVLALSHHRDMDREQWRGANQHLLVNLLAAAQHEMGEDRQAIQDEAEIEASRIVARYAKRKGTPTTCSRWDW